MVDNGCREKSHMTIEPQQTSESRPAREPTRRVFFALWPDEALRAALDHATHKAVRACGGRPVPVHNLHATLLFLGSIAESRLPDLGLIAEAVATDMRREPGTTAELVFNRIECWEKAAVLVATTSESSSEGHTLAGSLAEALRRETARIGIDADLKPFRAHITLARKVRRPGRSLSMHPVNWNLTGFALVESRTEPEGAVYRVLRAFFFRQS
jgi:2'-5' RNA ligase